jgi:hypothetical protein
MAPEAFSIFSKTLLLHLWGVLGILGMLRSKTFETFETPRFSDSSRVGRTVWGVSEVFMPPDSGGFTFSRMLEIFPSHAPGPFRGAGGLLKSQHMVEYASAGKADFHNMWCFGRFLFRSQGGGVSGGFGGFLGIVFFMQYIFFLRCVVNGEKYFKNPPKAPKTPPPHRGLSGLGSKYCIIHCGYHVAWNYGFMNCAISGEGKCLQM